jgi:hypothetical protein
MEYVCGICAHFVGKIQLRWIYSARKCRLNLIIYWMYSNCNPRIKSTLNQHNEIGGLKERENMHVDYREDKQIHLLCCLSFPWLVMEIYQLHQKYVSPAGERVHEHDNWSNSKASCEEEKAIFTNLKANKLEKSWSSLALYGGQRKAWWPAVKSRWGGVDCADVYGWRGNTIFYTKWPPYSWKMVLRNGTWQSCDRLHGMSD